MSEGKPIVAICGKGGAGKTVVSALLARVLVEAKVEPLLLVDADPLGGLGPALGMRPGRTLGGLRDEAIAGLRAGSEGQRRVADTLDYRLLETLVEGEGCSLLAMGRSELAEGCFCPVHGLLRSAIDALSGPFRAVVIDAEAGVEQIRREVTRRVTRYVVVVDGSRRATTVLEAIAGMAGERPVGVVANRCDEAPEDLWQVQGVDLLAVLPEEEEVRRLDREGRPLAELPASSPLWSRVRALAAGLGFDPRRGGDA